MALHWAWAGAIGGAAADYTNSDWTVAATTTSVLTKPRQPLIGYGGMKYVANPYWEAGWGYLYTPAFPKGALADGIVQFHVFLDSDGRADQMCALYDRTGGTGRVLGINFTSVTYGFTTLAVYAGDPGAGHYTLRGTSTLVVNCGSWHTICIRFATGAAGEIDISIDGIPETIFMGDVQYAGNWDAVYIDGICYVTGLSVWDDPGDDAFLASFWQPELRPHADASIGSWSDQDGAVIDLYKSVDDTLLDTATYDTTTTDPDVLRFDVDINDIDASWAPATIAGVSVTPSSRGDGTINQTEATVHSATPADSYGTVGTSTANSRFNACDVFPLDPDGAAWTVANITACEWGVRAS